MMIGLVVQRAQEVGVLPMISARPLPACASGWARVSSIVSASPGQPGVYVGWPAAENRSTQLCQLRGVQPQAVDEDDRGLGGGHGRHAARSGTPWIGAAGEPVLSR